MTSQHPAGHHPRIVLAVLATATTTFALLQSMVIPVLPLLERALHSSATEVTWLITGYLLAATVATPILGRLGDVYGKERLLVVSLLALAVGCVVSALATNLVVMVAGRIVQGLGGAVFPLAFGIIRDELPRERVAPAIGMVSSLLAVGGSLGLVLAGPINDTLDYHWLFWTPVPLLLVSALAAHRYIPGRAPDSAARALPSPVGAVLLAGWLIALLLGVSRGSVWGWSSARSLGLFGTTLLLLATWIAVENRSTNPLVDLRLMREPSVLRTNGVALMLGCLTYSTFAIVPQLLQTPRSTGYGFGATVTQSGLLLLPSTVASFTGGQLVGRTVARIGARALTITGTALSAAGLAGLAVAHSTHWQIYLTTGIFGLGNGMAFASMTNLVVESVPASQTGVAAGVNTNIRTIGGAIGGQTAAAILTGGLAAAAVPLESGYVHAFLALTAVGVVGVLAAVAVPRRRPFAVTVNGLPERELVAA
jgi:MFS family permease